jgi:Ca2+-binding RTX toxin-like protein
MYREFESLENRRMFAVTASFSAAAGLLTVFGDSANNAITVNRNAAGQILVNGGAVAVKGGTPTVANTALIQIFGQGGNDTITLDEANGALPRANLFGGSGNDTLTGGSGRDQIFGQSGNDQLLGKGGFDFLFGGSANDTLTGGTGDDQVFGESGNDRMIWNNGDNTDLNEGGGGIDTVEVNGATAGDAFTVAANGARVRFDRANLVPFSIDIGTSENLVVNMNGGDDSLSTTGDLAALIKLTADGGAGNDTILGSNGIDLLLGGDGDDFIDGQQGNDVAFMGAGDDVFQWDPGDGSDVVEGQDGFDSMLFFGSDQKENFEFSANGSRVRFTRDLGNIAMDLAGVERTELRTLRGSDTVIVNDLTGTDLTRIELALRAGDGGPDGLPDSIVVNGSAGADTIAVGGDAGGLQITSNATTITVFDQDPTMDSLTLNGLAGNDNINAQSLKADAIRLTINSGDGDDVIVGHDGADLVNGGRGNDTALLGAQNDTFVWNPGDGDDVIEGQEGFDTMLFNGANIAEKIDIFAKGGRVLFTRDIANVVMDLNDTEAIIFNALGGADNIAVNDLSGTDVTEVDLNLGVGDGQADSVIVNGTNGDDDVLVTGSDGSASVLGLATVVNITGAETANDLLQIIALAGDDVIEASALGATSIALSANGGDGNDVLVGGEGNDRLLGGAGDDVLLGGPGIDVLDGQDGDDIEIQG